VRTNVILIGWLFSWNDDMTGCIIRNIQINDVKGSMPGKVVQKTAAKVLRSGLENMIKAIDAYVKGDLREMEPMKVKLDMLEDSEQQEEDEAAAVFF
jgi:hypothetical protein